MSLMTWEEALRLRKGKRLVFTNGVFDILHAGHVGLLEQAKAFGEVLIVAINSDDSVRRLGKGPHRPVNSVQDRAVVLAALRCIDGVIQFEEDTPIEAIQTLQPDVHIKGGDYDVEQLPETPVVREYGGNVVVLPFLEGRSTTSILKRLGAE